MMIDFKQLQFCIQNDTIRLVKAGNIAQNPDGIFCEVQVAGFVKDSHLGVKMVNSSEGRKLRYVSHVLTENSLVIVQKSALVEVTTLLFSYDDCDAVHVTNCVKCICPQPIVLEEVSSFVLPGIGAHDTPEQLRFTKFVQSHHAECQPDTRSFDEHGLYRMGGQSQKRIAFSNVGSWSTKEALPQGMIFGDASGSAMMFQIESSNSWYYEIGDLGPTYYLYLGGANATHGAWSKQLSYGEVYTAPAISLAFGKDLNTLLAEMTKCRRHIAGKCKPDADLPSIFNEYMHLSWDSPSADTTHKYAPTISALGVKYYVIDCGWHNEEDGNIIYPFVGQWKESNKRFPLGVRETTDYIRSLGMKAGLWIEPEIIGTKCAEMIHFYDDDCFLSRNGKRIGVQAGSVSEAALEETSLKTSQLSYANLNEAFEGLRLGEVDYVLCDAYPGAYLAAAYDGAGFAGLLTAPTTVGIAAPTDKSQLQLALKEAIAAVSDGGSMDIIRSVWIAGMPALTEADVIADVPIRKDAPPLDEWGEVQDGTNAGSNAVVITQSMVDEYNARVAAEEAAAAAEEAAANASYSDDYAYTDESYETYDDGSNEVSTDEGTEDYTEYYTDGE
jgi:hypothetical protein